MDNNKFFRFLWRINAILILCVLVLISGKFVYEEFYQQLYRESYESAYNLATYEVDPTGETVLEERWRYGRLNEVINTFSFVLPLYSIGNTDESSYQLRNLLFVDVNLENSQWLLPDNQKNILSYEFLRFGDYGRVSAVLYEVTSKETDVKELAKVGNGVSIYLSRPDGKEFTQVVVGLDRSIGHTMINKHHLVIFYVKGGVAYADKITLSDFSVVESITLPPIE